VAGYKGFFAVVYWPASRLTFELRVSGEEQSNPAGRTSVRGLAVSAKLSGEAALGSSSPDSFSPDRFALRRSRATQR